MIENLEQFFDSSTGDTVSATFKTALGATIRTTLVFFTDALGNIPAGEVDNEGPLPFLSCREAALAGVDHSCKVVINSVTYRIIRKAGDGQTAIVLLQP